MVEKRLRDWITLQRLKGKTDSEILKLLVTNNYSREDAIKFLEETKGDPEVNTGEKPKILSKKMLIILIVWGVLFVAWLVWGYMLFFKPVSYL